MRWSVPPDCSCPQLRTRVAFSFSGDSFSAAIEPEELSCGKWLKVEGISLHLKTEDGAFDEVVSGTMEGQVSRDRNDEPLVYRARFVGLLSPTPHGSYDISRVTKYFAEPQIELQYSPDSGSGTIVVTDGGGTAHQTQIASWDDQGVPDPAGTGGGCQGRGGGAAKEEPNYTAGTPGLCYQ